MKARLNIIISGRHRLGQDDPAEHPLELHPARPPDHHDRGRRRTPAPAGSRRAARNPAAEHRGPRRRHRDRPRQERPAYASRPDHHRRVPRRRDPRHDPGHEHRPRRLDDHRPRQHPARRPEPARNHDQHGRPGTPDPRPPLPVRLGRRPDHPGQPAPGRPAQGHEHLRGRRHGRRHDHHAGDLRLQASWASTPNGRAFGEFIATGVRPTFMDRLEHAGYQLTADLFRQRVLLKD